VTSRCRRRASWSQRRPMPPADVLRGIDGDVAAALEGIAYAPIVVAPVGIEQGRTREPIEGFGFLVPARGGSRPARMFVHEPALPGPRAGGPRAAPLHARRRALARGGAPARRGALGAPRRGSVAHARHRRSARAARLRALAARGAAAGARSPRAHALALRAHRRSARARARGILRRGRQRVGRARVGLAAASRALAAVPFA
jgi:hypothetical protein